MKSNSRTEINSEKKQPQGYASLDMANPLYKALIENVPVGLYRTTSDGRILYANPYLVSMMGYDSLEQLQERNLEAGGFHEDGERNKFKKQLGKNGKLDSRESVWIKRDGSKFFVVESARIVDTQPDGTQIFEGFATDITARKLAEMKIQKSERKYRELFEGITDGIVKFDNQGRITEANKAFLDTLGYNLEELRGLTHNDITPAEYHALEADILREKVLPRGYSDPYEKKYIAKNGELLPFELITHSVRDNLGGHDGFWALARNLTKRKQNRRALEQSEAKLLEAQQLANIGNWEWDMLSGRMEMSAVARQIYGHPLDKEMSIQDVVDYMHPEDREFFRTLVEKAHNDLILTTYEYRVLLPDNTVKYVNSNQMVSEYRGGRPVRMTGTLQDITEIKHYQLALEESQDKLLEAQQIGLIGNWEWDLERNSISLSEMACRIYGFTRGYDLSVDAFYEVVHPDDHQIFRERLQRVSNGDTGQAFVFRVVKPDGSLKYLQSKAVISRTGASGITRLSGVVQDITELKQYQFQLEQNQKSLEERLKQEKILSEIAFRLNRVDSFRREINALLLETALIIEVDQICFLKVENDSSKLNLMYCSNTSSGEHTCNCALVRYLMSVAGFKDCITTSNALIVNDLEHCDDATRNGLGSHNIHSFVALPISIFDQVRGMLVFSNGEKYDWSPNRVRFLQTLADVITSAWGRDMHYHARLDAERKSRESARLLAQSSRLASLGVMAGGIAHEINQPLNAIRLTADSFTTLSEKGMISIPEKYLNRLQKISDHVCRIDVIIQKMRHLWSPAGNVEKQNFDINAALKRATSSTLEQYKHNEVNVEFDLVKGQLMFLGNPLDLDQIVVNLLSNSLEAMDALPTHDRRIRISSKLDGNSLRLRFEDNGRGFGDAEPFKLFDPFYSTKTKGTGMGLGLPIVKKIVENNAGTIDAVNLEPHGAAFEIILPLKWQQVDSH